jgi:hypothetical protein
MNVLFQFLFDVSMLQKHVRQVWCTIYDSEYIDDVILGNITHHLPQCADLIDEISKKATGTASALTKEYTESHDADQKKGKKDTTKCQPFNLTKPKPRALPEPILIERKVETRPVPEAIYKTSLKEIEDEKKKRRDARKAELVGAYMAGGAQKFELETEKRPTNLEKVKEEVEKTRAAQIRKLPAITKTKVKEDPNAEVKLNMAALLREDAMIRRKMEEEQRKLEEVEQNMRDSGEFEDWKDKQRKKEELDLIHHQQRSMRSS